MEDWTVAGPNLLGIWSKLQNVNISALYRWCLCKNIHCHSDLFPGRPFGRWLGIWYSVQPVFHWFPWRIRLCLWVSHHSLRTPHSAGQDTEECSSFVFSFGETWVPSLYLATVCGTVTAVVQNALQHLSLTEDLYQIRMYFILNKGILLEEIIGSFF